MATPQDVLFTDIRLRVINNFAWCGVKERTENDRTKNKAKKLLELVRFKHIVIRWYLQFASNGNSGPNIFLVLAFM